MSGGRAIFLIIFLKGGERQKRKKNDVNRGHYALAATPEDAFRSDQIPYLGKYIPITYLFHIGLNN